tara:strand:- start:1487 stop:1591 length:105 start_codon:yes stop_codon:yes gene_type:complete
MTAAAYFIAHLPQGFFPLLNGGELAESAQVKPLI